MFYYNQILTIFCAVYIFNFVNKKNKLKIYVKLNKKKAIFICNKVILGVVFYGALV